MGLFYNLTNIEKMINCIFQSILKTLDALMIILQTDRLVVEEATLKDSSFIFELLNSPTWVEFIGDRGITALKDAERYIQESLIDSYQKNGFGLLKICLISDNKPIGLCGFLQRDYLESVDIGYALLPTFEGNGYAFEAAKAIIDYGKIKLKLNPILAITSEKNKKSQKLLHKLGLFKKGTFNPEGSEADVLLFSSQK